MYKYFKYFTISLIISLSSCSWMDKNEKKELTSNVKNYIKDKVPEIKTGEFVKNIEFEIDTKSEDFDTDFRISSVNSIHENTEDRNYLLNQTNISRQSDDTTINFGFINRKLSEDKNWIYGFNLFLDHEFPADHQRASLGMEIKSQPLEFNMNYYEGLSESKTVGSSTEKVMDGVDYELGIQIPYIPSSKLFVSGYEWEGENYDVKDGKKLSLKIKPNKHLSIEIGVDDNNRYTDSVTTGKIVYNFYPDESVSSEIFSDEMFKHTNMSKNLYDTVRRQNRIVKTVSGTVTVARGT